MFIRRIFRKPLIIILYIVLISAGLYALSHISQDISATKDEYRDIYLNTEIECKILSSVGLSDNSRIGTYIANAILNVNEVIEPYTESFANARINTKDSDYREENQEVLVFGTNDIQKFLLINDMVYSKLDENLDAINNEKIVHIGRNISEEYDIQVGDIFEIYTEGKEVGKSKENPIIKLYVCGILDFKDSKHGNYTLVVNNDLFFDEDLFLHTSDLREKWGYYNKFEFKIDPKYNSDFESVEKKIKNMLSKDYILHSTSREFYNVIQPLKDKIKLQENLYIVIKISLILLTSFIAFLLTNREKQEILIRLIYGESKIKILLSEFINISLLLLSVQIILYLLLRLAIEVNALLLVQYFCINVFVVAVNLSFITKKSLLRLYQEGED